MLVAIQYQTRFIDVCNCVHSSGLSRVFQVSRFSRNKSYDQFRPSVRIPAPSVVPRDQHTRIRTNLPETFSSNVLPPQVSTYRSTAFGDTSNIQLNGNEAHAQPAR